jgi:hypothetical protein
VRTDGWTERMVANAIRLVMACLCVCVCMFSIPCTLMSLRHVTLYRTPVFSVNLHSSGCLTWKSGRLVCKAVLTFHYLFDVCCYGMPNRRVQRTILNALFRVINNLAEFKAIADASKLQLVNVTPGLNCSIRQLQSTCSPSVAFSDRQYDTPPQ